ncbi:MAG: amino acid adenylation domain-containing protein [Byssovorax sp.]
MSQKNIENIYSLSPLQQGILFHAVLGSEASAYFMQYGWTLTGSVDLGAFTRAWEAVVARHPILRTAFVWERVDKPLQVVWKQVPIRVTELDLRGVPEGEQAARLTRLADEDRRRAFDLTRAPLMRFLMVRLRDDAYRFLWSAHHLLSDGWSISIVFQEVLAFYEAFSQKRDLVLPRPRPYSEYIAWLQKQDKARTEAYFRRQLEGFEAPTALGVDRAPPEEPVVPLFDSRRMELPAQTAAALAAFGPEHQLTMSTLVQGAWALLLSRYAGTGDVVFGSIVSGRSAPIAGIEKMVGVFINTLPVRVKIDEQASAVAFLGALQRQQAEAREHEHAPLVEVQALSEVPKGTPLFNNLLVFENYPVAESIRKPGAARELSVGEGKVTMWTNYPLTVVAAFRGSLTVRVDYDRSKLEDATIERMLSHLGALLESIAKGPHRPLAELSLLPEAERRALLGAFAGEKTAYPRDSSIQALFEAEVDRAPDSTAVTFEGQALSYRQLDEEANRLAHLLRRRGVGPESPVGVHVRRSLEMVIAILGILKAGGAYVPLDPELPPARVAWMIEDAGIAHVICKGPLPADIVIPEGALVDLDAEAEALRAEHASRPLVPTGPESLAYLMYTSGSTGVPKGVCVPHRAVVRLVRETTYAHFGPDEVFLQLAPLAFDASTLELWGPLLNGGRLAIFPPERGSLEQIGKVIAASGTTTLWLTAGLFNAMIDTCPEGLRTLRQLLIGGEALSAPHVQRGLDLLPGVQIINGYGPTECTTFSVCHPITRQDTLTGIPIGRPISNTTVYVLDAAMRLCPIGVPGELYIGGDGLGRGYLNRPELSAERFVPSPFAAGQRLYRTGDWVRLRPDGALLFLGRRDQQIKLRGFRIELGEIEARLAVHDSVASVAVVMREDSPGDKRIVAYVVPRGEAPLLADLQDHLRSELPEYMVPSAFVFLADLPLTPNGKVDRKALPAPDLGPRFGEGYVAPRTPVEEVLAGIWASVLKVENIGIHDDFFALGGHSLLATLAISRLRESFGVELPLRALFEAPTPAAMGETIEQALRASEGHVPLPPLVRGDPAAPKPLSFSQERLWFLDQLAPGGSLYNIPMAMQLGGSVDTAALARALTELCRRHESLRTVFAAEGGKPVQIVKAPVDVALPVTSLMDLPEGERETAALREAESEAARPFDLAQGPLFRARLFSLGEGSHLLLLTMHHIVSDGWSSGILKREVTALYEAFREGKPSPLPELPLQYGDYAAWQRRWLDGEGLSRELAYWSRALEGAPEALDLPTDRPHPPRPSYRGGRKSFSLGPDLSRALQALARKENVTIFMLLVAAFDVLLHRYTGQTSVVIGTPVAGRGRGEVEGLIGFFVNTLVLKADLDAEMPFRDLLAKVKETCLGAYSHADLPFERLVQELAPERDLSRSPLFQVMFILQRSSPEPKSGGPRRGVTIEGRTSKFDLTVTVNEGGPSLTGSFEYALDLFDAPTIDRMMAHFHTLLDGIARAPAARVGDLPLVPEVERQTLLVGYNPIRSDEPKPSTMHGLFEAHAARDPGAPAVRFGEITLSYGEVDRRSNQLARRLQQLGVGVESRVGLCLGRSPSLVIGLLAILKAGGAYVPLDPAYPRDRLAFMLADADLRVIVSEEALTEKLPPHEAKVLCLDSASLGLDVERDTSPDAPVTPGHAAYVIYTSGSTGLPKGVVVEHKGFANLAEVHRRSFGAGPGQRVLQLSSINFDASVWELCMALFTGGTLVLAPPDDLLPGPGLLRTLRDQAITALTIPPSVLAALPFAELPSLQTIVVAGEACPEELVSRWAPGRHFWDAYGPTEATICATMGECFAGGGKPSIGKPLANVQVYILDARQNLVPTGVPGELCIGGIGLSRGYLGRPELTAEKFIDSPFVKGEKLYRSGDRARFREGGAIEFFGRLDDQVKLRGFRIELGEIEAVLQKIPGVDDAVVVLREDARNNPILAAYVVASGTSPAEIRAALRDKLPEHMVPSALVSLDALPLSPSGKVDRRALPAPEEEGAGETDEAETRGPVEDGLAAIFAEVLGLASIGAHDGFFDRGGHSLLATQVISRVRDTFGVDLPLRTLFEAPTPAALAHQVEGALRGAEGVLLPPLAREPEGAERQLSFAQERLWFLDQLNPGDSSYNLSLGMQLLGALSRPALERALAELARRHEVLRTTFVADGGRPAQIIHPELDIPLEHTSLHAFPAGERAETALRLAADVAELPFDLARGPLCRAHLFEVDEGSSLLVLTMHHIVFDGWSVAVLRRELTALYESFQKAEPPSLPELPIQYADYAAWQRRFLSGEALTRELSYWTRTLRGAPDVLDLPADRPRPPIPSHRGGRKAFALSAELSASLQALCQRHNVTLFMLLCAAFDVLLYRYTGQGTFLVGTPIAGRSRKELEGLIGFFVNTLVLRADLDPDLPFLDLLAKVRETCLGAYSHADLPFERLVQELAPERDMSRSPLFQVMFVLQNASREAPLARQRAVSVESRMTKFDLKLTITERRSSLGGAFEYAKDLFDAATIDRMIGHFVTLLEAIAGAPATAVGALPLLTPPEREQLVVAWNDTKVVYPQDRFAHELFEAQAAAEPDATAVVFEGESLSYRQLDEQANRLAHRLIELGAGPDRFVGVCLERSLAMVIAVVAVLKAGGAYVPLDPEYPRDRLAFMLEDAGAPVLVTERRLANELPPANAEVLCLDEADLSIYPASRPPRPALELHHLAYLIYTSGSTGRPKGAMNTQGALLNRLLSMQQAYPINGSDRVLHKTPFGFDVSVWELFWPLTTGARLVVARPGGHRDPAYLAEIIAGQGITAAHFVPSMLEAFLEHPASAACHSLRYCYSGGEALTLRLLQKFYERRLGASLHNLYGPAEAAIDVTTWPCRPDATVVPIGKPFHNVRAYVLDERQNPVPIGVRGELYIGGVQVGRGYLNRPDLTAERFLPDPFAPDEGHRLYRTGDLCRVLPSGDIEFLGRADHQVKLRGYRIELGEIESVLARAPSVKEVVVLAREDEPGEKRLVAYLVPDAGEAIDAGELRNFARERLPVFMVPAAFVVLPAFPLSANGKVDRKALPAPDKVSDTGDEPVAPRNEVEEALARIWASVLRTPKVGIFDNFFALGGDSILSIQIVSRSAQAGLRLTPRQIFQHQTIAELAEVAEKIASAPEGEGAIEGPLPLTPIAARWIEQKVVDPHHYNQAVFLEAKEALDHVALDGAIQALIEHHDALRIRLALGGESPALTVAPTAGPSPLSHVDLREVPEGDRPRVVKERARLAQQSLNLAEGPVIRAVHFDLGAGMPGRVLLVIHHLAVDGVSWRILIEDLWTAYAACREGQSPALPARTTSIKRWAAALGDLARSSEIEAESTYWLDEARARVARLPVDHASGENLRGTSATVSLALSPEETESLLRDVPPVYGTQINDLLLTALGVALRASTGSGAVLFELEGHGREEIAPGLDLSRTVGWFTAVYPVLLDLGAETDPRRLICAVKEQLRAIPRRGLGYGLLRYLRGDEALSRRLAALPQAEVSFNYLGQLGQVVPDGSPLRLGREPSGEPLSPRARRAHLVEVSASVAGGRLQVSLTYSPSLHEESTIRALGERYTEALRGLTAHCLSPEAGGYTASDFHAGALSPEVVDRLASLASLPADAQHPSAASRKNVEDIYPLSPMQEGMLFHTVYGEGEGVYVAQLDWSVRGDFDLGAFQRAFQRVIDRHAILRTLFVWEGLDRPLQVVCKQVSIEIAERDLRALSREEQTAYLRRFAEEDRSRDFVLTRAPLLRVTVLRLAGELYRCFFSSHHILLDGWSMSALIRELIALYEAFSAGREIALPHSPPYADFIAWLSRQDPSRAEAYYRALLQGFSAPTPFGVDRPDGEGAESGYDDQVLALSQASSDALVALARAHQLTLNTLVQGAYALVLSRYSGEDDVVFGTTVSGRSAPVSGVDRMMGLFINTIPARVRVAPEEQVLGWLLRLQDQQIEAREHEHTPLVRIQAESEVPRGTPLFESILVFENFPVEDSMAPAAGKEAAPAEKRRAAMGDARVHEHPNYPLTMVATITNKLSLRASFDRRRFDRETVARMLRHLQTVVESFARAPQQALGSIGMLGESEQRAPRRLERYRSVFHRARPRAPPLRGPGRSHARRRGRGGRRADAHVPRPRRAGQSPRPPPARPRDGP